MESTIMTSSDRRVQRTKNAIYNALFTLIQTKPLENITVTELCAKANINRKTFYLHYNSIADIVDEATKLATENLYNFIHEMSAEFNILTPEAIFRFLFLIFEQYRDFITKILKSRNSGQLTDLFTSIICNAFLEEMESNGFGHRIKKEYRRYIAMLIATCIVSVFREWYLSDGAVSIDEITTLLSDFFSKGLTGFYTSIPE